MEYQRIETDSEEHEVIHIAAEFKDILEMQLMEQEIVDNQEMFDRVEISSDNCF